MTRASLDGLGKKLRQHCLPGLPGLPVRKALAAAAAVACMTLSPPAVAAPSLQAVVDRYTDEGFSGHALVVRGNQVLLDVQLGKASFPEDRPFAPEAPFYIGSVSKQFAAVALLQLQERGLLRMTDKVSRFLPTAPHADAITIHQILSHTSGLKNYTDLQTFWDRFSTGAALSPQEILDLTASYPLDFAPGSDWSYSNTGYVMAGMILETITGVSFDDYLQEHLLAPAGMTRAGYTPGVEPLDVPSAHAWDRDYNPVGTTHGHMSWAYAAGGIYASAYDMVRWSKALHGGTLLSPASYRAMTTPVLDEYGYGLLITAAGGKAIIGHGGGLPGFTCQVLTAPAEDVHVVVLSNQSGLELAGPFSAYAMMAVLGVDFTLPPALLDLPRDEDELAAFAGRYKIAALDLGLRLFIEQGRLYVQADGQTAWRLLAQGDDAFALRIDDIRVQFRRDAAGAVTGLTLFQGGEEYAAERTTP